MAVLYVGGEDVDAVPGLALDSTSYAVRAGYSRCGVSAAVAASSPATVYFSPFPGGAVTSCWFSSWITSGSSATSQRFLGLVKSGTGGKGLWLGLGTAASKLGIHKFDGTTRTTLASEAGTSLAQPNDHRIDLNLTNYGASATIDVYCDGVLVIEYSGDPTVTGVTDLDQVALVRPTLTGGIFWVSQLLVADEDCREWDVVTYAPSAAGDASAWIGAYSDVDEIAMNLNESVLSNTAGQDFIANLPATVAGSYSVKAVKIAACAVRGDTGITGLSLGVKSGGTVNVDSAHTLATSWATVERYMPTNPVTEANWTTSDLDAVQLVLRSAT